jgi:CheY-like chemotaxis protein
MGYQADLASNGLQAIEAVRRQPYDVVLMDMQMPEMDGLTASRRLCEEFSEGERPRIIAMTANAMQGDREECLQAGMDDYISKPIRVEVLIEALRKCEPNLKIGSRESGVGSREDKFSFFLCEHSLMASNLRETGFTSPMVGGLGEQNDGVCVSSIDAKLLQSFRDMVGEDADAILVEMIDLYLEDAPKLVSAIASAVERGDAKQLHSCAHTLKSSSLTLGATILSNVCKELEALGRNGHTESGLDKVPQLEAEYAKVKAALQIEREQALL